MSTYAQIADLIAYTTISLNTPEDGLQALLNNSEKDIDRLFNPTALTDSLQGLSVVGDVIGGTFLASELWLGSVYTSPPIPWDTDGPDFVTALCAMRDIESRLLDASSWMTPDTPAEAPDWAAGPLPAVPIVVQATGFLGGQALPPLVLQSSLEGGGSYVVTQFRGGGVRLDPWQLWPAQVAQLRNACCAQAEYRDQMGEDFYIRSQWASVSGPEFKTTGKLPHIGSKVLRELQGSGLIQYSARAAVGTRAGASTAYSPTGGTPIPDDWRAV
jgi:hypothetical protein